MSREFKGVLDQLNEMEYKKQTWGVKLFQNISFLYVFKKYIQTNP